MAKIEPTEYIDAAQNVRKELLRLVENVNEDWMTEESADILWHLYDTSFDLEFSLRDDLRNALCKDLQAGL